MKPLQVYIADEEFARLEEWTRERGMTKSEALRLALRALTRPAAEDPILSLSGLMRDDLPPDCAEHFDRYLQETFVAEAPATYPRQRRPRSGPRR